ncbi:hypothetical protein GM418_19000 [Maribellus comscasis]|uniref:YbbR-like domain-containing protein n=1 Tax=Maribellus comscasis TaxID=2681766 RepID=A0A6I6JZU7_9BACT|nr:hypothetical protein [Maribellus comscasis]QGY45682.1 hypothetical protein GM418_19000 [Maribellus comscasis]
MKIRLSEITGYFKIERLKDDKQIVVFLICLLIATALWFLNALSKDYTTTVSYPVKFVSPPSNQFVSNKLPPKFELQVDAHGFTLLRHKLSLSFSPIVINLTQITRDLDPVADRYSIRSADLINIVSDQISNEISVTNIRPDNFIVVLDSLKTKSVPVRMNAELNFKPQFNLKDPVSILPETVSVTGPAILLDSIQYLETEFKLYERLDTDMEKVVAVKHPEKTSIKPEKVTLRIPVEKFTEKELKVPIQIKNKPDNVKIKLFPSEVTLSFLVGLSEFENVTSSDFVITVDYNSIKTNVENIGVKTEHEPTFIEILRISPQTVEYLIETD